MASNNIGHEIPGPVQVFVSYGTAGLLLPLGIAEDGVNIVKEYEFLPVRSDLGNVPVNYVYHGRFVMCSFLLTYSIESNRQLLDNPLRGYDGITDFGEDRYGMRGSLLLPNHARRLLLYAPYANRYNGEQFHNFPTCKINSMHDELKGSRPSMFPYVIEPVGLANLCSGQTYYYDHDGTGFPGDICATVESS